MHTRPTLLFHCQHAIGMGHLIRSLALAEAFADTCRVVFLNGGPIPAGIKRPDNIDIVDLPALGLDTDGTLLSRDAAYSTATACTRRRELILHTFHAVQPQVVLIELFPFGRKKFAAELLPLLEAAHRLGAAKPLILCSVRDILVGERKDQYAHDVRASLLVQHYFDAVLVHADPQFIRLEATFSAPEPLRTPIYYTGFVFAEKSPGDARSAAPSHPPRLVVSAGGGLVGGPLLRLAVEAQALLRGPDRVQMTLVAGPFLPEADWQFLQRATRGREDLELRRSVPDLSAEMRAATASISQCGYNTAMDILHAGVPSLVVPFATAGEDEQMQRARRLEQAGVIRVLDPQEANGTTLAAAITQLLAFQPAQAAFDLHGARHTVQLVEKLLRRRPIGVRAAGVRPSQARAWLEPLRQALDAAPEPVLFFFRDDDAGWEDKRLLHLLSLIEHLALPLDLAVIPTALTPVLAQKLRARIAAASERLSVHQHGLAHSNHEPVGRKCEFGPSRSFAAQYADISAGKRLLAEHLEGMVAPMFTPPWNRCTADTARCLVALGFEVLSRDASAQPLHVPGLRELCIRVDWFAKCTGNRDRRLSRDAFGRCVADAVRHAHGKPIGIMLHHALMDDDEQAAASELLFVLATHRQARCHRMQDIAARMAQASESTAQITCG